MCKPENETNVNFYCELVELAACEGKVVPHSQQLQQSGRVHSELWSCDGPVDLSLSPGSAERSPGCSDSRGFSQDRAGSPPPHAWPPPQIEGKAAFC